MKVTPTMFGYTLKRCAIRVKLAGRDHFGSIESLSELINPRDDFERLDSIGESGDPCGHCPYQKPSPKAFHS